MVVQLQCALKRPWIGWAFHAKYTTHSRGVSLLLAKSVHFEKIVPDPQGRYVFLYALISGSLLIIAYYIPPRYSAVLWILLSHRFLPSGLAILILP